MLFPISKACKGNRRQEPWHKPPARPHPLKELLLPAPTFKDLVPLIPGSREARLCPVCRAGALPAEVAVGATDLAPYVDGLRKSAFYNRSCPLCQCYVSPLSLAPETSDLFVRGRGELGQGDAEEIPKGRTPTPGVTRLTPRPRPTSASGWEPRDRTKGKNELVDMLTVTRIPLRTPKPLMMKEDKGREAGGLTKASRAQTLHRLLQQALKLTPVADGDQQPKLFLECFEPVLVVESPTQALEGEKMRKSPSPQQRFVDTKYFKHVCMRQNVLAQILRKALQRYNKGEKDFKGVEFTYPEKGLLPVSSAEMKYLEKFNSKNFLDMCLWASSVRGIEGKAHPRKSSVTDQTPAASRQKMGMGGLLQTLLKVCEARPDSQGSTQRQHDEMSATDNWAKLRTIRSKIVLDMFIKACELFGVTGSSALPEAKTESSRRRWQWRRRRQQEALLGMLMLSVEAIPEAEKRAPAATSPRRQPQVQPPRKPHPTTGIIDWRSLRWLILDDLQDILSKMGRKAVSATKAIPPKELAVRGEQPAQHTGSFASIASVHPDIFEPSLEDSSGGHDLIEKLESTISLETEITFMDNQRLLPEDLEELSRASISAKGRARLELPDPSSTLDMKEQRRRIFLPMTRGGDGGRGMEIPSQDIAKHGGGEGKQLWPTETLESRKYRQKAMAEVWAELPAQIQRTLARICPDSVPETPEEASRREGRRLRTIGVIAMAKRRFTFPLKKKQLRFPLTTERKLKEEAVGGTRGKASPLETAAWSPEPEVCSPPGEAQIHWDQDDWTELELEEESAAEIHDLLKPSTLYGIPYIRRARGSYGSTSYLEERVPSVALESREWRLRKPSLRDEIWRGKRSSSLEERWTSRSTRGSKFLFDELPEDLVLLEPAEESGVSTEDIESGEEFLSRKSWEFVEDEEKRIVLRRGRPTKYTVCGPWRSQGGGMLRTRRQNFLTLAEGRVQERKIGIRVSGERSTDLAADIGESRIGVRVSGERLAGLAADIGESRIGVRGYGARSADLVAHIGESREIPHLQDLDLREDLRDHREITLGLPRRSTRDVSWMTQIEEDTAHMRRARESLQGPLATSLFEDFKMVTPPEMVPTQLLTPKMVYFPSPRRYSTPLIITSPRESRRSEGPADLMFIQQEERYIDRAAGRVSTIKRGFPRMDSQRWSAGDEVRHPVKLWSFRQTRKPEETIFETLEEREVVLHSSEESSSCPEEIPPEAESAEKTGKHAHVKVGHEGETATKTVTGKAQRRKSTAPARASVTKKTQKQMEVSRPSTAGSYATGPEETPAEPEVLEGDESSTMSPGQVDAKRRKRKTILYRPTYFRKTAPHAATQKKTKAMWKKIVSAVSIATMFKQGAIAASRRRRGSDTGKKAHHRRSTAGKTHAPKSVGKAEPESVGKAEPESPGVVETESAGVVESESPGVVEPESVQIVVARHSSRRRSSSVPALLHPSASLGVDTSRLRHRTLSSDFVTALMPKLPVVPHEVRSKSTISLRRSPNMNMIFGLEWYVTGGRPKKPRFSSKSRASLATIDLPERHVSLPLHKFEAVSHPRISADKAVTPDEASADIEGPETYECSSESYRPSTSSEFEPIDWPQRTRKSEGSLKTEKSERSSESEESELRDETEKSERSSESEESELRDETEGSERSWETQTSSECGFETEEPSVCSCESYKALPLTDTVDVSLWADAEIFSTIKRHTLEEIRTEFLTHRMRGISVFRGFRDREDSNLLKGQGPRRRSSVPEEPQRRKSSVYHEMDDRALHEVLERARLKKLEEEKQEFVVKKRQYLSKLEFPYFYMKGETFDLAPEISEKVDDKKDAENARSGSKDHGTPAICTEESPGERERDSRELGRTRTKKRRQVPGESSRRHSRRTAANLSVKENPVTRDSVSKNMVVPTEKPSRRRSSTRRPSAGFPPSALPGASVADIPQKVAINVSCNSSQVEPSFLSLSDLRRKCETGKPKTATNTSTLRQESVHRQGPRERWSSGKLGQERSDVEGQDRKVDVASWRRQWRGSPPKAFNTLPATTDALAGDPTDAVDRDSSCFWLFAADIDLHFNENQPRSSLSQNRLGHARCPVDTKQKISPPSVEKGMPSRGDTPRNLPGERRPEQGLAPMSPEDVQFRKDITTNAKDFTKLSEVDFARRGGAPELLLPEKKSSVAVEAFNALPEISPTPSPEPFRQEKFTIPEICKIIPAETRKPAKADELAGKHVTVPSIHSRNAANPHLREDLLREVRGRSFCRAASRVSQRPYAGEWKSPDPSASFTADRLPPAQTSTLLSRVTTPPLPADEAATPEKQKRCMTRTSTCTSSISEAPATAKPPRYYLLRLRSAAMRDRNVPKTSKISSGKAAEAVPSTMMPKPAPTEQSKAPFPSRRAGQARLCTAQDGLQSSRQAFGGVERTPAPEQGARGEKNGPYIRMPPMTTRTMTTAGRLQVTQLFDKARRTRQE